MNKNELKNIVRQLVKEELLKEGTNGNTLNAMVKYFDIDFKDFLNGIRGNNLTADHQTVKNKKTIYSAVLNLKKAVGELKKASKGDDGEVLIWTRNFPWLK